MPEIISNEENHKPVSVSLKRAEKVMKLISEGLPEKELGETISFLKGLPSMIRQNGIGQTLAFIKIKKHENIFNIFKELIKWDLEKIQECDDAYEYNEIQNEAIKCAGLIKEFALAYYIEPEEED